MFAWSRTTYAFWHGIVFNFEHKQDRDYFIDHSDAEPISAKEVYDMDYKTRRLIQVPASVTLGANKYRKKVIKDWHENKGENK